MGVFQCMDRLRNFIVTDARGAGVPRPGPPPAARGPSAATPSAARRRAPPRARADARRRGARRRRLETRPFALTRDGVDVVEERRRSLGSVLVPGKHLVRVEASAADAAADPSGALAAMAV